MNLRTNIGIIIQARMNSSRLPGKILMDWGGKPMLHQLIDRVKLSNLANSLIVATTNSSLDDDVENLCNKLGVFCFRGSEKNVQGRFLAVAKKYQLDVIVRLTADNPFVGADLVDEAIACFMKSYPTTQYLGNIDECGYPHGLYVEVVLTSVLEKVSQQATALDAEHVTWKLRNEAELFNAKKLVASKKFNKTPLTVDTIYDRNFLLPIFENLYRKNKNFGLDEISNLDH